MIAKVNAQEITLAVADKMLVTMTVESDADISSVAPYCLPPQMSYVKTHIPRPDMYEEEQEC